MLEVFCPPPVTLDSTSSFATDRRQVDDFGINDELPENPFLFVLSAGRHPTFPDLDVLITHPDGVLKLDGRQRFIHNQKGVYHEVQYTKKGRKLFLFDRREDLERHNQPRRDEGSAELEAPSTPKKTFGRLRQISSRPASPSPLKGSSSQALPEEESRTLSPLQILQQNFVAAGEPPKTPSSASTPTDPVDTTIWNTPIKAATLPVPSSTHRSNISTASQPPMTSLQQSSSTQTIATTGNPQPSSGGGGGGRGGGGGEGGGGGGGGGGAAAGGAAAGGGGNAKLLGTEPPAFNGNRQDVDRFLSDLQGYMSLNRNNANIASFIIRIHLALSFITGEEVRNWKNRMRVWADDPATLDHQDSWDQFLEQFRAEYADTQKAERARTQIEDMHMKNNNIDQYITDFISMANDAGYHLEGESTKRTFVRGLGKFIAGEVYRRVPNPYTWQQVRDAARVAVNWAGSLNTVFGATAPPN